jgi:ribosomal protein L27
LNVAVLKVHKQFISHPTRDQHTVLAAGTVQVSHAQLAVRFSYLLRGRGTSFQYGAAVGEGFVCTLF